MLFFMFSLPRNCPFICSDTMECERALTALNNIPLADRRITLWPSKREHVTLSSNPETVQMDFSNSPHHRFLLSKNVRSISGKNLPPMTINIYNESVHSKYAQSKSASRLGISRPSAIGCFVICVRIRDCTVDKLSVILYRDIVIH